MFHVRQVETDRRFRDAFCFQNRAENTSATLANTTQRNITEESHILTPRSMNLKSHIYVPNFIKIYQAVKKFLVGDRKRLVIL
jgi:hypothetical protein